jgi:hypothetical protein
MERIDCEIELLLSAGYFAVYIVLADLSLVSPSAR